MQRIAGFDPLLGIQVIPPLAALVLRSRVPHDGQRLQASVRKWDEILLQRCDAERVLDLELGRLAIAPVSAYQEFAVALIERAGDATAREARIGEVAQYGLFSGEL